MLYYLFTYLDQQWDFPGAGVFRYISFRAAMALITSLLIAMIFGGKIIDWLRKKQIGADHHVSHFNTGIVVFQNSQCVCRIDDCNNVVVRGIGFSG
jgi:hypothetical protein